MSHTRSSVRRSLKYITIGLAAALGVVFLVVAYQYYLTSNLSQPWILVIFSYLMSALVVANVFLWTVYAIMFFRLRTRSPQKIELTDIIRDESGFPSLATLQFLIWTFIVSFAFLAIFFIRWYFGIPLLPTSLPDNLLILMGISIAVPVVSAGVSQVKYGARPSTTTETIEDADRRNLTSMLMENGKLTVFRFQMFAWTWITVVTYLISFGSYTVDTLKQADEKTVPDESLKILQSLEIRDVPQIYVVLMGLSQGAYIGSKMAISRTFAVTMIMPTKVSRAAINSASGKMITIIGTNFGSDTDKRIWFEPSSPSDAQWIGPSVPEPKFVSENSIRLDLPKNALEVGKKYFVRVESKGMLTDRRIKEDVDAAIKVTA